MSDATMDERNALLDELTEALNTWYEKESSAIQTEIKFLNQVAAARASSVAAAKSNTKAARILVIDDISSFLAGL